MSSSPIDEHKPGTSYHERNSSDASNTVHERMDVTAINEKLANPLQGLDRDQVQNEAEAFAKNNGLAHLSNVFRKAALVAQDPEGGTMCQAAESECANPPRFRVRKPVATDFGR